MSLGMGIRFPGQNLSEQRMTICRSCPAIRVDGPFSVCAECGCILTIKTRLAIWHCPIGKW